MEQLKTKEIQKFTQTNFVGAVLIGLMFGFFFERSQVWRTEVIQRQMLFTDNTMLKLFLAASAVSAVVTELLNLFAPKIRAKDEWINVPRGVASLAIGGLFIGCGMTMSGSCPGTVWVQIGTNTPGWLFTLAGGFAGAAVYSLLHAFLEKRGMFGFLVASERLCLSKEYYHKN
jgi:uncharacterized membrane protein YedE/YeeE